MSAKTIGRAFILSLLMLHMTMIKGQTVNCLGKDFFCTADNAYLTCSYDEASDTFIALITDRSQICPLGTFCDESSDVACDQGIDCAGKEFLCPTVNSYLRCAIQADGTFRTTSNDEIACPEFNFCDSFGESECDSLTDPSTPPTTTTTLPTTTVKPTLGELDGYTCAGEGQYPHPTDCHRYIYCSIVGSKYRNRQYHCDNDLVYDPVRRVCSRDTTPCDNLEFKCTEIGRFSNPVNPNKYYFCLKWNGVFVKQTYSCPVGKMFDGINACVEPIITKAIETLALFEEDPLNLYGISKRSLSVQKNDESDEDRYVESDEVVADRINLNSNEDASVYNRAGEAKLRL